jgi:steroid delta-isomerase-like uncharacterized protein
MSSEENKALVRRFFEETSRGNLDVLDELMSESYVDHNLPPGLPPGREGQRQLIRSYLRAFPDLRFTIEDLIAEGDKVVTRGHYQGTQQGEFLGIPPTGKQVNVALIDIVRLADGKLVEHWIEADNLGMLQQLGAIPMLGQPSA